MLDQVFSTGGTLAKSGALSNGYWCLNVLKNKEIHRGKGVFVNMHFIVLFWCNIKTMLRSPCARQYWCSSMYHSHFGFKNVPPTPMYHSHFDFKNVPPTPMYHSHFDFKNVPPTPMYHSHFDFKNVPPMPMYHSHFDFKACSTHANVSFTFWFQRMFHPRQCIIHILILRMSHPRQSNSTQQNSQGCT